MIAQIVTLEVQADKLEAFLLEVGLNAQASLLEPGVVSFDVLQDIENPLAFMLYELYTDPGAVEAHRQTPHFKRWVEAGVPLLNGDRTRSLYHLIEHTLKNSS